MAHDHAALLKHIKADMPSDELLQDLGDLFKIFQFKCLFHIFAPSNLFTPLNVHNPAR